MQTSSFQPWRSAVDILIEPDVHHILWDEFAKTPHLIAAGEDAAFAALPRIKTLFARGVLSPRPVQSRRTEEIQPYSK